ncbi:lipoprotein [Spiroplasma endosymbiont of Polydrusus pterygomalis]|uniref:lipoprotein n=1 Tax=Spiroplasma endosymbiont of Polydrusus pterygomalis TaxID=3139327 RepID=UPI003CCA8FEA
MKKILSIIGVISLIGASITSLVACNTPQEYTPEELAKLKEKNKIDTINQEIRDNLEWIEPQEKPFNKGNQKLYFVIWKHGNDWILTKFKDSYIVGNISLFTELDKKSSFSLKINKIFSELGVENNNTKKITTWSSSWKNKDPIKSVYRWNGKEKKLPNLYINENCNVKVSGE